MESCWHFLLEKKQGLERDKEAFRLSQIGVENKEPLAFSTLGLCYNFGRGVEKDVQKAIRLYTWL